MFEEQPPASRTAARLIGVDFPASTLAVKKSPSQVTLEKVPRVKWNQFGRKKNTFRVVKIHRKIYQFEAGVYHMSIYLCLYNLFGFILNFYFLPVDWLINKKVSILRKAQEIFIKICTSIKFLII